MPSSPHAASTPSRSGVAFEQRVLVLHRDEGRAVAGRGLGLAQLRDGEVRAADLAHLARLDEFAQRAQRVGDGHRVVGVVQLVEVDVVGAESAQRVLAGAAHVVGLAPKCVSSMRHAELGRDDDLVAAAPERHAEQHLGLGGAVDVGGVEEGDARLEGGVHDDWSCRPGRGANRSCCTPRRRPIPAVIPARAFP